MKNLIINNPYRILGVYVGDSPALEQKNLARFRAFEKVGQTYEISLEGEGDLPRIERSEQKALEASQRLSLPEDRIRYSLLWYSDGKTEWGKTLDAAVSSIVNGDYAQAIKEYEKLITMDELRNDYVSAVTYGLGHISMEELSDILAKFFNQDPGYREFLYNTDSVPSCFLSQWMYRSNLESQIKESDKKFEELIAQTKNVSDFYKAIDELKRVYAKTAKDLSVCRKIFGGDSIEYQEYAIRMVKSAYQVSTNLINNIGTIIWNQKYKTEAVSYKKYHTKLPKRAIAECMRLMREVDEDLTYYISELRLNQTSTVILYAQRQSYQSALSREYVTDEEVLRKSNHQFLILRGITLAVWLYIVITIIVTFI